jgi:hypothetical protein
LQCEPTAAALKLHLSSVIHHAHARRATYAEHIHASVIDAKTASEMF